MKERKSGQDQVLRFPTQWEIRNNTLRVGEVAGEPPGITEWLTFLNKVIYEDRNYRGGVCLAPVDKLLVLAMNDFLMEDSSPHTFPSKRMSAAWGGVPYHH